jgi:asparagine synthase (glutamine-hydrolysing)
MCGICGIITTDPRDLPGTLSIMNNALVHRGPDDEGYYHNDNFGMAMRRLSIIDLKTGHQPMFSTDKRLAIIFNGEIYNFHELREKYLKEYTFVSNSDTEVILYLYHKLGKESLDLLHGIFAFAVYDFNVRELFIARDHIGVKPLYYYSDSHNFLFSSDIISFHKIPFIDLSINHTIIREYLRLGYIPHPVTIFNKIHKLQPGHFAVIKDNAQPEIFQYYKFWERLTPEAFTDFDDAQEKQRQLIGYSVSEQMISDVPLGAFLSGGIDSSIITWEMATVSKFPVKTFTIGFRGATNNSDLYLSSLLSARLKLDYNERIIEPDLDKVLNEIINSLGEPFAITSAIPIYINSAIAREKVKVVLSGDGADEVFGGYGRYHRFASLDKLGWMGYLPLRLVNDLIKELTGIFHSAKLNKAYLSGLYPFLASLSHPDEFKRYLILSGATPEKILTDIMQKDALNLPPFSLYSSEFLLFAGKNGYSINSLMAFDVKTSLVDEMLTKVDFASMLASLEVRVPFLDRRIVEFGLSLPSGFKINRTWNKRILREAYADRLPQEIMNAPKRGFNLPLDNWIKNDWAASFKMVFDSPSLAELGISKASLHNLFDKYLAGYPVNGKIFYYVFILASWYENLKRKRKGHEI